MASFDSVSFLYPCETWVSLRSDLFFFCKLQEWIPDSRTLTKEVPFESLRRVSRTLLMTIHRPHHPSLFNVRLQIYVYIYIYIRVSLVLGWLGTLHWSQGVTFDKGSGSIVILCKSVLFHFRSSSFTVKFGTKWFSPTRSIRGLKEFSRVYKLTNEGLTSRRRNKNGLNNLWVRRDSWVVVCYCVSETFYLSRTGLSLLC